MSVINQVLSDLEKRGAAGLPGDTVIRAVPVRHKRRALWLIMAGGVVTIAAVGLWGNRGEMVATPPLTPPAPIHKITAQENPAPAELPAPPGITAAEPSTAASKKSAAPAMRLSFELSSIPLPSNLHAQSQPTKHNASTAQKSAAKPAKPAKPAREKLPAREKPPVNADKQIKQFSAQQILDNEFRRATTLVQQGRSNEAYAAYEAMLQRDAGYDGARQAMIAILLDSKRNVDAEHLLQDGLQHNVKHSGFAMLLARLQVERGALPDAVETLRKTLPYADRQAEYQAFVAALLQRQNNHQEAIEHYKVAVQLAPHSGVWLMGMGISLHALQHNEEARDVFKRAIETGSLSVELQAFVAQRLKELG